MSFSGEGGAVCASHPVHRHALSFLVLWMRPNFDLDTLACELLPQYRALDGEDVPHETKSDRLVLRKGGLRFPTQFRQRGHHMHTTLKRWAD